jgi:hypothetical protein
MIQILQNKLKYNHSFVPDVKIAGALARDE